MKIDHNDPRLTAYALDELAESDRLAFETALAGDPEARQEVERIQRAAGNLKEKLEAEPCPRLEPAQRNVIYEKVEPAEKATSWGLGWFAWLAGAAALVVVGTLMLPALSTSREKARKLAVNTAPMPPAASRVGTELNQPQEQVKNEFDQLIRDYTYAGPTLGDDGGIRGKAGGGIPSAAATPPPAPTALAPVYANNNGAQLRSESEVKIFRGTDESEALASRNGGNLAVGDKHVPLQGMNYRPNPNARIPHAAGTTPPNVIGGSLNTMTLGEAGDSFGANGGLTAPVGGGYSGGSVTRLPSGTAGSLQGRNSYWSDREEDKIVINSGGKLHSFATGKLTTERSQLGESASTPGTENYEPVYDNPFYAVTDQPLSTFGLDVDTASYSNIRRFLLNKQLPPRDAVRIEELLNYFTYDYPAPRGKEPFALYVEMGECPWNPRHQLALVGLKAKDVTAREQPPLNLVFLIDVSGSMQPANKLPLIKQALRLLVPQLTARDRVSIVVYASNSRVALSSTRGDDHRRILSVIDELNADGSTNGGDGIQQAYAQAAENFIKGGINRVILCTDGDFNVGITDQSELTRLIEDKAKSGVFLNVFGFGMGNLKDSTMQKLANKGNGQYAYLDDIDEARKALVDQARATLITVAKDVKLQVEFNPTQVQAYRLIGYEKRQLVARDFNNDKKDAGDMGAGHTVTALYEIVPAGEAVGEPGVDALKYQPAKNRPAVAGEWATVKLRYKEPNADKSQLLTTALKNSGLRWRTASDDFQFAAAVAAFGMILRDSGYKGEANLDLALELAAAGRGRDVKGYRTEFADLVKRAGQLAR